jgi:Lon protease-like protein
MTDAHPPPGEFAGTARLFPLPNVVLFPGVVQGLHVFEPRYRQLVRDALGGDCFIALALLKPGWEEDYEGSPAYEPVACLGHITWHEKLADGRFNLRLRGFSRLRIVEEMPTDRLYRLARAELMVEAATPEGKAAKKLRRQLGEEILPRFEAGGPARGQIEELFTNEMPLGQLCDVLGYALPLALEVKQGLLAELDALRRATALLEAIRAAAARGDRDFPPSFSAN